MFLYLGMVTLAVGQIKRPSKRIV